MKKELKIRKDIKIKPLQEQAARQNNFFKSCDKIVLKGKCQF